MVKGPNGFLYGVTQSGVTNPHGTLYRFNPNNYSISLIHAFDSLNINPNTRPLLAGNNKLYGTTEGRITGPNPGRSGTLYEYDMQNNTFSVIETFHTASVPNGWYQSGNSRLVEGTDSSIYGVREGWYPYYGRVYRYNYSNNTFDKIYEFDQNYYPQRIFRDLLFYNDNLYISAYNPTNLNSTQSTIIKLNLSQSTPTVSAQFDFIDSIHGGLPNGEMFLNADKELNGSVQSLKRTPSFIVTFNSTLCQLAFIFK